MSAAIRFSVGRRKDLALAVKEKVIRINAVGNGATNVWHPVKHQRRLIWVLEKELAEDINYNGEDNKRDERSPNNCANEWVRKLTVQRFNDGSEETHDL